jgi:hypothetical protein
MDEQTAKAEPRSDFEDWSGGFPPESDQQIYVYVTHALSSDFDELFALKVLRAWMEAEASG